MTNDAVVGGLDMPLNATTRPSKTQMRKKRKSGGRRGRKTDGGEGLMG